MPLVILMYASDVLGMVRSLYLSTFVRSIVKLFFSLSLSTAQIFRRSTFWQKFVALAALNILHLPTCVLITIYREVQLCLLDLLTNNGVFVGPYRELDIMRGNKWKRKKFPKRWYPKPIALTKVVIKDVPSYFCGGVYHVIKYLTPCFWITVNFSGSNQWSLRER